MPEFGGIVISDNDHVVALNGRCVRLSRQELVVFRYLLDAKGHHRSREMIISWLYQLSDEPASADEGVGVVMYRLRKKLSSIGNASERGRPGPGSPGWCVSAADNLKAGAA